MKQNLFKIRDCCEPGRFNQRVTGCCCILLFVLSFSRVARFFFFINCSDFPVKFQYGSSRILRPRLKRKQPDKQFEADPQDSRRSCELNNEKTIQNRSLFRIGGKVCRNSVKKSFKISRKPKHSPPTLFLVMNSSHLKTKVLVLV